MKKLLFLNLMTIGSHPAKSKKTRGNVIK